MKEGAFLPIRKPRDPANEVTKYKQNYCANVDGVEE